jgi:cystathionine gamma-lyase
MRAATRLIHAVYGEPTSGEPMLAGPAFVSTYPHAGDPTGATFTYGRTANPTWAAYEAALAELEGGSCLVFASGLAAMTAVLGTTLRSGDAVVLPADGYFGAREFATGYLARMGVEVRLAPTVDDPAGWPLDGARLVVVETPSNPLLDVCDIRTVVRAAHEAGALVAVDNTTPTALGQRPLDFGVDIALASDTKAMSGHSDLLLGHVATTNAELLEGLLWWRSHAGAIPGPMETWLAHRSLATLDVRLARQCGTALRVAEALAAQHGVLGCRYPGLPQDPAHTVAAGQMARFGPVVNFTLADEAAADHWIDNTRLAVSATSFGGVHSTAERRARWGGDDVPAGFIRLSVGLEDADDLVDDVLQAMP